MNTSTWASHPSSSTSGFTSVPAVSQLALRQWRPSPDRSRRAVELANSSGPPALSESCLARTVPQSFVLPSKDCADRKVHGGYSQSGFLAGHGALDGPSGGRFVAHTGFRSRHGIRTGSPLGRVDAQKPQTECSAIVPPSPPPDEVNSPSWPGYLDAQVSSAGLCARERWRRLSRGGRPSRVEYCALRAPHIAVEVGLGPPGNSQPPLPSSVRDSSGILVETRLQCLDTRDGVVVTGVEFEGPQVGRHGVAETPGAL